MSAQLRIGGVTIPANKHICIGLTDIYGVGRKTAIKLCHEAKVTTTKKGRELSTDEEAALREVIAAYTIEGDLRRKIASDKLRLKGIQCYRALRHLKRLPCRGQRTRTNSQTASRT